MLQGRPNSRRVHRSSLNDLDKPTTTVLATINTVDFFYTCPTHLADAGFASPFQDPEATKKPAVSQEDIGKAIKEYEESQKRKKVCMWIA